MEKRGLPMPIDSHDAPPRTSGWLDLGAGWLFDSIRDAVVVADAGSGEIALWNPAATDLFGFSADEVLGHPLTDLIVDLREAPEWTSVCGGAVAPATLELFAARKQAADVCVELTLSRLQDASGARAFVLAVVRDITERRMHF